jgi:hypothetical protein
VLKGNPVPDALCDAMAKVIPIRNEASFRNALRIFSAGDVHAALTTRLRSETLSSATYQAPKRILAAYQMIGHLGIFDLVSAMWPGPRRSADDIKRSLANYVKRRNQIAHEGDREASGAVRHMQPKYANDCADFTENLVSRLNRVVYPRAGVIQRFEAARERSSEGGAEFLLQTRGEQIRGCPESPQNAWSRARYYNSPAKFCC